MEQSLNSENRYRLSSSVFFALLMLSTNSVRAEVMGDFDGDGKTDVLVSRRDNQTGGFSWFVLRSSDGGFSATQWGFNPSNGMTNDLPVLGDFDGDGKTDIGVFRTAFVAPATFSTYFFILRSSDGTLLAAQWGYNTDFPMAQDYDGDGKTDIAVARQENIGTVWYILGSRDGYFAIVVPAIGFPVRGDYDGDGKADCAVVRSDNTYHQFFHIRKSSTGRTDVTEFGNGLADYAIPGDYDGDGKTDIAVWRGKNETTTGFWYWIRSSDGNWAGVRLGTGTSGYDYPVPGDYDGDGKTDPAIYRGDNNVPQQAYFYILGSRAGYYGVPWGNSRTDDAPLFSIQAR